MHPFEGQGVGAMPAAADLDHQLPSRKGARQHDGVHGGQRAGGGQAHSLGIQGLRQEAGKGRLALIGKAGLEAIAGLQVLDQGVADEIGVVPQDVRIMPLPKIEDLVAVESGHIGPLRLGDAEGIGLKGASPVADAADEHVARPHVGIFGRGIHRLVVMNQRLE